MARKTEPMIDSISKIVIDDARGVVAAQQPDRDDDDDHADEDREQIAEAISWLAPPNCSTVAATLVWNSSRVPPKMSSSTRDPREHRDEGDPARVDRFAMTTPHVGAARTRRIWLRC